MEYHLLQMGIWTFCPLNEICRQEETSLLTLRQYFSWHGFNNFTTDTGHKTLPLIGFQNMECLPSWLQREKSTHSCNFSLLFKIITNNSISWGIKVSSFERNLFLSVVLWMFPTNRTWNAVEALSKSPGNFQNWCSGFANRCTASCN